MDSASENEYLSADSLENDGSKTRQKKKKLRKVSQKRRRTYLELYQSRLVAELLRYQKCVNDVDDDSEKTHAETQREVRKKPRRRHYPRSENVQQKNSKIEMRKRATEYGCRMSSLNRINSLCKIPQRQTSSSSQSLFNDNSINENASTSKISIVSVKEKEKKESACEDFKRKNEELQAKLEQMQIRHCHDKRKAEKIRMSLMSNGIDEFKMKEI